MPPAQHNSRLDATQNKKPTPEYGGSGPESRRSLIAVLVKNRDDSIEAVRAAPQVDTFYAVIDQGFISMIELIQEAEKYIECQIVAKELRRQIGLN